MDDSLHAYGKKSTPAVFERRLYITDIYMYIFGCLFVWVLWHINLCRLFNAKSIFMQIVNSISNNSV